MKFSIIIPCYNEEKNLSILISNILELQKKYDLEYILVENGSKDNSKEYFKQNVEGKYQNLKVVYVEKNQGYGYGVCQGLKAASGKYIGWIHADMQVPPQTLCEFFDYINNYKGDKKLFLKGLVNFFLIFKS